MLAAEGHEVMDLGTHDTESCDYPDFAARWRTRWSEGAADRGILVCSTGIGMAMAANKVDGRARRAGDNPETRCG